MMEAIKVLNGDKEIRTGQPIVVQVQSDSSIQTLKVEPKSASTSILPFQLPLQKVSSGNLQAEFTLSVPGSYLVTSSDNLKTEIVVVEQRFMNFGKEFGIFSTATFLLVGGMILWLKIQAAKKKTTRALP